MLGAEDYVTSCDLRILVNQSAEPVALEYAGVTIWRSWTGSGGDGGALVQGPVRPVRVAAGRAGPGDLAAHDRRAGYIPAGHSRGANLRGGRGGRGGPA